MKIYQQSSISYDLNSKTAHVREEMTRSPGEGMKRSQMNAANQAKNAGLGASPLRARIDLCQIQEAEMSQEEI